MALVLFLLSFILWPLWLLIPFTLISTLFFPLFKLMMPDLMKRRGY